MFRRVFSRRHLMLAAVCYAILWLLTATVGVRRVRSMALHRMELDRGCVEVASNYVRPPGPGAECIYSFSAVSYAPFVVAVNWMSTRGEFTVGASGVILWFGKSIPLPPFHSGMT